MKRRLLLGCGYLGDRVARRWRDAGDSVTTLTRSPSTAERLRGEGIEAIVGDVCEPDSLRFEGSFDSALYCVGYDRDGGRDRRTLAVEGPRNLIETMAGRVSRWVFTSTTSVYGQTDGEWVDESSETRPQSDSGRVAVDAEAVMRTAGGTILRLAGLYGPARTLSREGALAGRRAMPGRGEQWLNLVHVEDAVDACLAAGDGGWPPLVLTCDNEPVRRGDYYGYLASLRGLAGPRFDGEPRTGRGSSDKRCRNTLLRRLCPPTVAPTFREGLAHALTAGDS